MFRNWYLFSYPEFLGYVYPDYLDLGFDDWSNYGNPAYDQNNEPSDYYDQGSGDQPEYPSGDLGQPEGESYSEPGEQPPPWPEPEAPQTVPGSHFSVSGLSAASAPRLEGPLTVIFKVKRAPEKIRNYMLTSKALTDLDAGHYEQIPLDQIDIAATERANRANGLQFHVPGASRD